MKSNKSFTLNFHSLYSDDRFFHKENIYSFHVDKLEKLFFEIKKRNLKVNFTFDDGHLSDLYFAVPLLQKFGFKATFFVIADEISKNEEKWNQTKKIFELGYKIGSHAYHHVDMTALDTYNLLYESFESKKIIERCINHKILDFSIPFGKYNVETTDIIFKAGFKTFYTTNGSPIFNENKVIHRWSIKNFHTVEEIINVIEKKGIKAKFFNHLLKLKHFKSLLFSLW